MNIGKEYINRFGKGIGASLLAMIMVLSIAVVLSTPASALPVPPGTNGIYWLEPASSSAPYGDSVTLDVWVNSSIPLFGGTFTIETDPDTCGEFVVGTFDDNTTYFDMGHAIIDEEKHRLFIGYQTVGFVERPPGPYHLGSFEIKCNSTSACTTDVEYIPDLPNTYITNRSGNYDTVEQDATFTCGEVSPGICCMCCADGCEPGTPCEYDPEIRTQEECTEAGGLWLPGETDPEACAQYHCDEEGHCVPEVATIVFVAIGLLGILGIVRRRKDE